MADKKPLPKGISIRKDGRYQGRYTFQGKRYTIYGKTLKEVQRKLRDAKYEMDHGIFAKPDKITVDSWFKVWMEEYQEPKIRENTYKLYESMYKHHIGPRLGKMKLQDVRPEHVQGLINGMVKKDYANSFIKRLKNVLSLLFKQAYQNDLIFRNPVALVTVPAEKNKKERRVLSVEEQKLFLRYSAESEFETLFYVGFFTGMRIGEILALQWKDIDFKKNEVHVNGTLIKVDGKEYTKGPTKTENSIRTIPILPELSARLKAHRKEQLLYKLKVSEYWQPIKGLDDLVFPTPFGFGRPTARALVFLRIDQVIDLINHDERIVAKEENREPVIFEHFSSHAMRHTFATRALENGMSPKVVQSLLGHKSIKTTMDIYTHVFPEMKAEEMLKISGLLEETC